MNYNNKCYLFIKLSLTANILRFDKNFVLKVKSKALWYLIIIELLNRLSFESYIYPTLSMLSVTCKTLEHNCAKLNVSHLLGISIIQYPKFL